MGSYDPQQWEKEARALYRAATHIALHRVRISRVMVKPDRDVSGSGKFCYGTAIENGEFTVADFHRHHPDEAWIRLS